MRTSTFAITLTLALGTVACAADAVAASDKPTHRGLQFELNQLDPKAKVTSDFTIEWWHRVDDAAAPRPVVRIGTLEVGLRPIAKAKPKDPQAAAFTAGNDATRAKSAIYAGRFYHLALVGRSGKVQFFVNGFADAEPMKPPTPPAGEVTILSDGWRDKTLHSLALYNRALSPDRILAHVTANIESRPIVTVAHRGVHKHAPENTRISYVQAVEAGAPIVEFDTGLTKDGHIVGMHDKTVDRTTDGTGKLAEMTLEQVRKLDAGSWKDPKYKGEPVPTLDEIADVVRGKAILMLDLKAEGQGQAIAKWLEKSKYPHDQLILAPWEDAEGAALRKHVPATVPMIRLTSKVPTETVDDAYFEKMKEIGFSGFSVNWQYLTEDFIRAAQKHGMQVYVWTLNEPPDIAGAALLGVDGVITDDPAETIKLLSELVKE
ncbi:MAG TPA: glycerophosphodiester phosphodiesterase family protein [Tepidisphaeraceae bacterium]|nr:glycerophosphodiester phosphodiesterase family protein [Tepidisphaeraceae bacterium]